MNCQECRKHLYPYLDDELEITQNLGILEHLNCCGECREIFSLEELSWKTLRDRLQQETAPAGLAQQVDAALWASDRRQTWRRATSFLAGAAAVLLLVIGVQTVTSPEPPTSLPDDLVAGGGHEKRPGTMPASHNHGPAVKACVQNFIALKGQARAANMDLLNKDFLEKASFKVAPTQNHAKALSHLCASDEQIPDSAFKTTTRVAYRRIEMAGLNVLHGVFDCDGQEIGIYQLTKDQARLAGLADLSPGSARKFIISRCKDCKVVTVRGCSKVWILVSRPKTRAAEEFAQQVF